MHSSQTKALQPELRSFPDNPNKEVPAISKTGNKLKRNKMESSPYNALTRSDKFINPRSYLQIKELDHTHSLHNLRHKVFIWKTNNLIFLILDSLTQDKIPPKLIRFVKLTLENITAKVKVNNAYTLEFRVERGVKQGDPLSPTLFSLVINTVLRKLDLRGNIST